MKTLRILVMVAVLSMVVSADGVPTVVTYVPNSKVTEVMTEGDTWRVIRRRPGQSSRRR